MDESTATMESFTELMTKHEQLENKHNDLILECEEIRQRSIKGNLIISCPVVNGNTWAVHQTIQGSHNQTQSVESDTELCLRLIREKTGVMFNIRDIVACHPLGRRDKNTYIIRIGNMSPGSGWETLTRGMMTGKQNNGHYFANIPVHINYQLTYLRSELCKKVSQAKRDGNLRKYSVDQNGRMTVLKKNKANNIWYAIKIYSDLSSVIGPINDK